MSLITDAYSRKIVGWAAEKTLSSEGPMKALANALAQRPTNYSGQLMHHSDQGVQYCSKAYTKQLKKENIQISMVTSGDPRDNGIAERVHSTLKTEMRYGKRGFLTYQELQTEMAEMIQNYNELRPHASLDYLTPNQAHTKQGELKKRWQKPDWSKPKKKKKVVLEDWM